MNTLKYKQLAVDSPGIQELKDQIKLHFSDWIKIVKDTHLDRTYLIRGRQDTPENCAKEILLSAIWGYGVLDWDPRSKEASNSHPSRKNLPKMEGTIPMDFYFLDQWLESLL